MIEWLSPTVVLLASTPLIGLLRGHFRAAVILVAPLISLWLVWQVPDGVVMTLSFFEYRIEPIEGSALRRLFATIFALMTFVGGLYAFRQSRWYEIAAGYVYAAGAIGVCFAGDLITLFVYWELMALFSTVVIWCGGTSAARQAGIRYATMHLLGGTILMIGIISLALESGSVDIVPLRAADFSTWMILIGLLVNVAAPPVSAWLADAYPEASPTGSVFLSAFTTKTAVFALILMFPGEPILIPVGLYMVMYGIIYALLENDARRILAYSIVNQVGFMVCAIGIGTELALNGAAAHAFAHIIYKALLFMSAGVVVYRTGISKCTELGGLFRTMPITMVCGVIGALSISGFPLTSGFTTKTMISQAAANEALVAVYFLLAAASAGVFLHAGIKFPWFVFFQKDSGLRPKDAPWNMSAAMMLFAALCIFIGVFPELLYRHLPYAVDFNAYTPTKVIYYLQLLMFSGLAFFLLLPLMRRTRTISLDVDWLWRVALVALARNLSSLVHATTMHLNIRWVRWVGQFNERPSEPRYVTRKQRILRIDLWRNWSIGSTALWIAVLLTSYVAIYVI